MDEIMMKMALVVGGVGFSAKALREFANVMRARASVVAVKHGISVAEVHKAADEAEFKAAVLDAAMEVLDLPTLLLISTVAAAKMDNTTPNVMVRSPIQA